MAIAVTRDDYCDGVRRARAFCPVAWALRRALRDALGEAAVPFEVEVLPDKAEVSLAGCPGDDRARLAWRAPLPKWLTDRIISFDRRAEPLIGTRCALTLALAPFAG